MNDLAAQVRQRRAQMLVHSYLYYWLDAAIIDDATWQRWADELVTLQMFLESPIGFYDAEFADWDGSTGMHLPTDSYVADKAAEILRLHERFKQ